MFSKKKFEIRADKLQKEPPFHARQEFPMIDTYPGTFPLGGFGSGTIGLAPDGTFLDWHFFPGVHLRESLAGCCFAFSVPQLKKSRVIGGNNYKNFKGWQKLSQRELKNLKFEGSYPLSRLVYEERAFKVEVGSFSPVIPHNYKQTSYPVAVFPVKLKNKSKKTLEISFMLSFQNLIGYSYEKSDETNYRFKDQHIARKNIRNNSATIESVFLRGEKNSGLNGEFCLAGKVSDEAKLYLCTNYNPYNSYDVWKNFSETGTVKERLTMEAENKCAAIVLKTTLNPNSEVEIPIALSWDLFTPNDRTQKYYLQFFEKKGENSYELVKEALYNYKKWQKQLTNWQKDILQNKSLSATYKKALFNELYYLASSSLWDMKSGLLAYLESFDFLFYDTLDVRYYGSFPLALLWPESEKKVMSYFGKTLNKEHKIQLEYNQDFHVDLEKKPAEQKNSRSLSFRKIKGALPHDLGSPFENVWQKVNAYTWQNPNRWKDLNSKFVLQTYRCFHLSGKSDLKFLQKNLSAMEQAVEYVLEHFDKDGDFLPENENFPDQTFDNWKMQGTSAYCGNLFLAALRVLSHSEQLLGRSNKAKEYRHILRLAKDSYIEKLWLENGDIGYFRFDEKSTVLMSAQMMGEWYLKLFSLPSVLPDKMIKKALETVYRYNFKKKGLCSYGLVNGIEVDGSQVPDIPQANDIWTGINYALASHLYAYGYHKHANQIIKAISDITYKKGFFYRTPESWNLNKEFVSSLYMRPGAIWSMEVARRG